MLAAHIAEVSSFYHRPSTTTMVASLIPPNMGTTTMPTFSKASEGLEGVPVRTFITINSMQEAINSKKLEASKASPYLIFHLVTTDDLLNIERVRESGKIDSLRGLGHFDTQSAHGPT